MTRVLTILSLLASWTLCGQSIVQDNLKELKGDKSSIKYTAKFLTRGPDSFGERFTISFQQRDTSLTFYFTAGDFEVWDQLKEIGTVSERLLNSIAEVEAYFKKNRNEFDGWVSYWEISI